MAQQDRGSVSLFRKVHPNAVGFDNAMLYLSRCHLVVLPRVLLDLLPDLVYLRACSSLVILVTQDFSRDRCELCRSNSKGARGRAIDGKDLSRVGIACGVGAILPDPRPKSACPGLATGLLQFTSSQLRRTSGALRRASGVPSNTILP